MNPVKIFESFNDFYNIKESKRPVTGKELAKSLGIDSSELKYIDTITGDKYADDFRAITIYSLEKQNLKLYVYDGATCEFKYEDGVIYPSGIKLTPSNRILLTQLDKNTIDNVLVNVK